MKKAGVYSSIVLAGIVIGPIVTAATLYTVFYIENRRGPLRERVTPGQYNDIYERMSVARYKWAVPYCKNKTVADMASGSGYGTKILLNGGATSVDGYDV